MKHRKIVILWLIWLLILWTYQAAVTARYQVQRPDRVLFWTESNTNGSLVQPYLQQPWLNTHVAWDSEFYLSIALKGYDDPQMRTVSPTQVSDSFDRPLSLNYAFFPVYPYLMRLVALPFQSLGIAPIAAATIAGMLISALGTLVGCLALYDLMAQESEAAGQAAAGQRAVYYLLSFPTSFFMAQVYTEGLFIGLSFGCLACLQRKHWLAAAGLAAIASLTRAVGIVLLIPLWWAWWRSKPINQPVSFRSIVPVVLTLPLIVHLIWRFSFWGRAFQIVQISFFKCKLLNLEAACLAWQRGFLAFWGNNPATIVYYSIEFTAILLAFAACLITLRRQPGLSVYGLIVLLLSLTCGTAWSLSRYVLTIPSLFWVLGQLGQSELFDRAWSLLSIMLLAFLTALFSFNLWAG